MPPLPGVPVNPRWIIADTDACLQLTVTNKINILHALSADYSTKTVLTEAVENEIENKFQHGKFRGYDGPFRKAIRSGVISVLDQDWVRAEYGPDDGGVLDEINQLGEELYTIVHRGEAYTHAAAIILGVPCLSNDRSAVNSLRRAGYQLTANVFRSCDVLALGLQIGTVSMDECNAARKILAQLDEGLPEPFKHSSFEDGLGVFFPRLLDADRPSCGATASDDPYHDKRFWIHKVRIAAESAD